MKWLHLRISPVMIKIKNFLFVRDEKRYLLLRNLLRIIVYCLQFIKQLIRSKLSSEFKKTTGEKYKLLVFVLKGIVRQTKPFNLNNDFTACEIMFIMRNKITFHLKMADCAGTGRARHRAGRPRSFKEGQSNATKRIYIYIYTYIYIEENFCRVVNAEKLTTFV